MPVENKDRRAHAFIESSLGYYLHATIYSPQEKCNHESCSVAHFYRPTAVVCWDSWTCMLFYIIEQGRFWELYNARTWLFIYNQRWWVLACSIVERPFASAYIKLDRYEATL